MTPSGVKERPENNSDIEGRVQLGLTMRKGESIQAHITLLHGTIFGSDPTRATGGLVVPNSYNTVDTQNSIIVNQAYGWWRATESMSLKAGRFHVEVGGGEFFSADSWKLVPITHEGFQVSFDTGFAGVSAFLLKDKELVPQAGMDSDPEQHNFILSADFKDMPEAIQTANLTFLNISRSENANPAANAQHVGLTLGGEIAGIFYKAVYGHQMGVVAKTAAGETKLDANMYDLTLGVRVPEIMGLRVWGNYHSDSGDDNGADDTENGYQSLYYDSHKYGGMMDLFGWGNLTYWNVGAAVAPSDDFEVGLSFFSFSKTKENGGSVGTNLGRTFLGASTNKANLGMELDLYMTQKFESGFRLDAHLATFMPGEAFKDAVPKREAAIMQLMVAGTMTF
ncbi:MAG: alginate export family protein [Bdellovibrionales bacterium]|jgi:hypothetical protein|nr:alginate export family protein [Bdellovibrionales bacterium]